MQQILNMGVLDGGASPPTPTYKRNSRALKDADPISPTGICRFFGARNSAETNIMNNIFVHVSINLNNISYKNNNCSFEDSWNIIKKQIKEALPIDCCGRSNTCVRKHEIEAIFKTIGIEPLDINEVSPISNTTMYNVLKRAYYDVHRTGCNRYISCIEIYAECGQWRVVPIKFNNDNSVGVDSFYINNSDGNVSIWSSVSRYSAPLSLAHFWNNCSFKDYYQGQFDPYVKSQNVPKFEWRERNN